MTDTASIRQAWKPVLGLVVLAPLLAEVISSATPVTLFFTPGVFLPYVLLLYGGPVLVLRELAVRLRLGPLALWCLGIGYGLYNEALHSETLFAPGALDVAEYADYGVLAHLRVPWTLYILAWHGLFSVVAPVLFVEQVAARTADRPWLPRWATALVAAGCAGTAGWYFLFDSEESRQLPTGQLVARFAAVLGAFVLVAVAARACRSRPRWAPVDAPAGGHWRRVVLGLAAFVVPFFGADCLAAAGLPWWCHVAWFAAAALVTGLLVGRRRTVDRRSAVGFLLGLAAGQGLVGIVFGLATGNPLWAAADLVFVAAFGVAAVRLGRWPGHDGAAARLSCRPGYDRGRHH